MLYGMKKVIFWKLSSLWKPTFHFNVVLFRHLFSNYRRDSNSNSIPLNQTFHSGFVVHRFQSPAVININNYNALFRILDRFNYKLLHEKNPKFQSTRKMQTKLFNIWGKELRNQSLIHKIERKNILCSAVLIYCTT